ncbi:plasmid replication protein RepC [Rhizobium binxianense]
MERGSVATPFGRRSMTLGMLASQYEARSIAVGTKRDKWKLFRAICEARPYLGVSDRALTVLDALLSFFPDNEISEERGLVVFPSNMQLSLRARGMAPATLRRHLAVLVDAGLILRKDSPNGKRYARRGRDGQVDQAFGFSLAPLLARAEEFEQLAARILADRELLRSTKERLTLCRRDLAKLIETALEAELPGDWSRIHAAFRGLLAGIPRAATTENITPILEEMELLREEVLNTLEKQLNSPKISARESQTERHIQDSHPEFIFESEPGSKREQDAQFARNQKPQSRPGGLPSKQNDNGQRQTGAVEPAATKLKTFPLTLVLQACPEISLYGPGGEIRSWRDAMSAAIVVRSMLGVSPSAYEEACTVMGPENAAIVMACVLERAGHINSPGGYLRDLTRRAEKGEFAIGPMVMALARANEVPLAKVG